MTTNPDEADLRAILARALTLADRLGHPMTAIRIAEAIDEASRSDMRSSEN